MGETSEQSSSENEAPFRYVHSNGFPRLLADATLLVTTYQAGKLCVFRASDTGLALLPRTFDQAMGVAIDSAKMAIATRYQIWFLKNEASLAPKIEPRGQHDACYVPRRSHVTGNVDLHEIAWGNDELWIVNTLFCCLCTLDEQFSFVPRWRPPFVSQLIRQDRCHLNGVAIEHGCPTFVTSFSETDTPEGWREHKREGGVVVHVDSGETVARGLSMPHSPRVYDGKLWVLDSGNAALVTVEPRTGQVDTVAKFTGYARGLAFHGGYAFVGLSKIREKKIFGGIPIAEEQERDCGVSVVELASGRIVAFLRFESTVEEIFDVQILPQIRYPEVVGFRQDTLQRACVIAPEQPIGSRSRKTSDVSSPDANRSPASSATDRRAVVYRRLHQDHNDMDALRVSSARRILSWLHERLPMKSILDVGCGIGIWLNEARQLGSADVFGIEGPWVDKKMLRVDAAKIRCHDLEQPFDLGKRFEMALCLEVAEHLSPTAGDGLIASLTRHSDVILFSAAIPGQGGNDHINEQRPSYWRQKFEEHGFVAIDVIRPRFWQDESVLWWLRQNLVLYVQRDRCCDPGIVSLRAEARQESAFDRVHPRFQELASAGKPGRNLAATANRRGLQLQQAGQFEEAVREFRLATKVGPNYAPAHCNLGNTLVLLQQPAEALGSIDRALRLQAVYPAAWNAQSLALRELGHYEDAKSAAETALAQQPGYEKALLSLAGALAAMGRGDEAAETYQRLLDQNPRHVDAWLRLSRLLHEGCLWPQSCAAAERAWSLSPVDSETNVQLLYTRSFLCDWRDREQLRRATLDASRAQLQRDQKTSLWPAASLRLLDDPKLQREIADQRSRQLFDQTASLRNADRLPHPTQLYDGKLRIGYVSAGFRDYPFGHLSRRLYGLHDRSRFEVFAYSMQQDNRGNYGEKIADDCDHFVDVQGRSPIELARRIAQDGIHMLIAHDTMIASQHVETLALRPAPVQVSWLYPGPCGRELVDYVLSDRVVTPECNQKFYSEQPILLPHTHYVTDNQAATADDPPGRGECGLPNNAFVFCCFNLASKIEPEMLAVWMRILKQVDGSVLWLLSDLQEVQENLRRESEQLGVAGDRLVFAGRAARPVHLARQANADLFLDTLPYNAHTTAVDAMWVGLPLLTCPGRTHASRVAASIVTAAGVPELIMDDLDEYERRAVSLATRRGKLNGLRNKLTAARNSCPLFDTEVFVRDLEAAYLRMWQGRANTATQG